MKMRAVSLGFIAALLISAASASAQIREGVNEVGMNGRFNNGKFTDEPDSLGFLEWRGFYGRSVTDRISIGPNFAVRKLEGEDATGGYGAFLDYHFGDTEGQLVPYVEVQLGRTFGDPVDNATVLGFTGGVKLFFGGGGGALLMGPTYFRYLHDEDLTGFSAVNEIGFTIGAAIYFP